MKAVGKIKIGLEIDLLFPPNDKRVDYVFPSRDYGRKIGNKKIGSKPYVVDIRATWKKVT